MGPPKQYLGIRIRQHNDHIFIGQEQQVKNITSRFEEALKHTFKHKDSPLPTCFTPNRKD